MQRTAWLRGWVLVLHGACMASSWAVACGDSGLPPSKATPGGAGTSTGTGGGEAGEGGCVAGTESCPCTLNQTCDENLVCLSHVCVNPGGGGGAAGASASTGGATAGGGALSTGGTAVITGGAPSGGNANGGIAGGGAPRGGSAPGGASSGGTGNAGGSASGGLAGAAGSSSCSAAWRNSSCASQCVGQTQPSKCQNVLDCYFENGCDPATCGGNDQACGVNRQQTDAASMTTAEAVYTCLCGQVT